jgi:S-adenosylmethionine:tRNA ribosyltransferase-isomerase
MGKVPLPPYMHRDTQLADKERYQTIYASEDGSVAAPTAGLHFTPYIFEQLGMQHITTDFLTLHVGAGTFKQVKSETLAGHEMHAEWIEFTLHFLENLLTKLGSVVAVGTTSMRTLESLYWLGLKLFLKQKVNWADIAVLQFDPYEMNDLISPQQALTEIIDWMKSHHLDKLITRTQIMIAPSYVPKIVNKLVTNFHQPHSTLLLLIAALIGKDWEMLYQFALNNDYRFLSYGDGCLIDFSA